MSGCKLQVPRLGDHLRNTFLQLGSEDSVSCVTARPLVR
jgi:hypothetical protein